MTPAAPRSRVGQLVVNVLSNYGYYVIGMGVMFLLTPYLNRHLGSEIFGDWLYLVGFTIYFSLADLGFNVGTVRFVAHHVAREEWTEAGQIMAASLRFFLAMAALFALTGAAVYLLPDTLVFPRVVTHFLKGISRDTGTAVFALIFLNWAIEMAFAPFNAVLFGAQRYDLARSVAILARLVKFGAILILIGMGYGVVLLAVVTAGEALLRGALQWWLVRRKLPQLPLGLRGARRDIYVKFIQFSAWILVSNLAYKMIMVTDNILVRVTRPAETEVVLYNATMGPIITMEALLWALAQVFVPFAAAGAALAEQRTVRDSVLRGARFSILIALPMITYLCLAGKGFYGAWMFNKTEFPLAHVNQAHHLLLILAPAFLMLFIQQPAIAVLVGTGRVRLPAILNLSQGVAKIVLSVVLVKFMGLPGIALGTVIPLVIANVFVLPWFVKRELGVGWSSMLRGAVLPGFLTLLLAGPVAWFWLWLTDATSTDTWRLRYQIPIALGVAVIFAIAAWFAGLNREDRAWVLDRLPWRRREKASRLET